MDCKRSWNDCEYVGGCSFADHEVDGEPAQALQYSGEQATSAHQLDMLLATDAGEAIGGLTRHNATATSGQRSLAVRTLSRAQPGVRRVDQAQRRA
jgi:hypothetical protein